MRLFLPEGLAHQITQHALDEHPREACGIIGGVGDQARTVIPAANIAGDPIHEYRLDDHALSHALHSLNRQGLSIVGFYHSHPVGEPIPSPADVQQASYPHTAYVIVGLGSGTPRLTAWEISYEVVTPIELRIGTLSSTPDDPLSNAQKTAVVISALLAFVLMLVLSLTLLPPAPPVP